MTVAVCADVWTPAPAPVCASQCVLPVSKHPLDMLQCEPAQQEVLNLAVKVLTKRFPDRFQLNGSMLTNASTGEVFDVAEKHRNPMDIAARLVQVCAQLTIWSLQTLHFSIEPADCLCCRTHLRGWIAFPSLILHSRTTSYITVLL